MSCRCCSERRGKNTTDAVHRHEHTDKGAWHVSNSRRDIGKYFDEKINASPPQRAAMASECDPVTFSPTSTLLCFIIIMVIFPTVPPEHVHTSNIFRNAILLHITTSLGDSSTAVYVHCYSPVDTLRSTLASLLPHSSVLSLPEEWVRTVG